MDHIICLKTLLTLESSSIFFLPEAILFDNTNGNHRVSIVSRSWCSDGPHTLTSGLRWTWLALLFWSWKQFLFYRKNAKHNSQDLLSSEVDAQITHIVWPQDSDGLSTFLWSQKEILFDNNDPQHKASLSSQVVSQMGFIVWHRTRLRWTWKFLSFWSKKANFIWHQKGKLRPMQPGEGPSTFWRPNGWGFIQIRSTVVLQSGPCRLQWSIWVPCQTFGFGELRIFDSLSVKKSYIFFFASCVSTAWMYPFRV